MISEVVLWGGFHLLIVILLFLDLGVFHRKFHVITIKEATIWSLFWVLFSLGFNLFIYFWKGPQAGVEFLTGYIIEKSLSIDNIFVFTLIFSSFHVPPPYQHKVLYWGIIGAILMRISFILSGVTLIEHFHFLFYIFGVFLCFTAVKFLFQKEDDISPEKNILVRLAMKVFPVTTTMERGEFFVKKQGLVQITPLFLCLLMIESADVVFAVDSIPAIFAITNDAFIIYTSNICAILGLRSLYFVLAGVVRKFVYLKYALSLILFFIGTKMLVADFFEIPIGVTLLFISGVLGFGIIFSWKKTARP